VGYCPPVTWLLVGVAGAAGAVTRYGIARALPLTDFPWATFLVNVTGSFLLGLVLTWGAAGRLSPETTAAVAVGFLGAYTTYSTFSWELLSLGRGDQVALAVAYLVLSVVTGVLAAWLGFHLASAIS
jgi:fluoride exporter